MLATLLTAAPRYGGPSITRGTDAAVGRAPASQRSSAPVEYVVEGDVLRRPSPGATAAPDRWDRVAVEQRTAREDAASPYTARRAIDAYQAPPRPRHEAARIDVYA